MGISGPAAHPWSIVIAKKLRRKADQPNYCSGLINEKLQENPSWPNLNISSKSWDPAGRASELSLHSCHRKNFRIKDRCQGKKGRNTIEPYQKLFLFDGHPWHGAIAGKTNCDGVKPCCSLLNLLVNEGCVAKLADVGACCCFCSKVNGIPLGMPILPLCQPTAWNVVQPELLIGNAWHKAEHQRYVSPPCWATNGISSHWSMMHGYWVKIGWMTKSSWQHFNFHCLCQKECKAAVGSGSIIESRCMLSNNAMSPWLCSHTTMNTTLLAPSTSLASELLRLKPSFVTGATFSMIDASLGCSFIHSWTAMLKQVVTH